MIAAAPNGFLKLGSPEKPQAPHAVLVAEDDPVFRHVLEYWLKKWDYRVTSVENGLDAWNILQKVDSPQMAILDWMMPAIDGVELCRQLRRYEGQRYHFVLLVTRRTTSRTWLRGGANPNFEPGRGIPEFAILAALNLLI
jgi:CheY-like chemotaxis protein